MIKNSSSLLDLLFEEIQHKAKNSDSEKSYTAFLIKLGTEKIAKKIIEEAKEVVEAALEKDNEQTILESADLIYHLLVLLTSKNIELKDVIQELDRRRSDKGLSQKAISKNKIKLEYGKTN